MDLATITRSIEEVGQLATAAGAKVEKQLGEITAHTQQSDARILALEQKILTGGGGGGSGPRVVPNLGEMLVKSMDFGELQNRQAWLRAPIQGSIAQILKSVLVNTGTSGSSPETGFPTVGELLPGGPFGFTARRLAILQALTSIPMNTAKMEYPKLTTNTAAAAVVSGEGAAKAETDMGFTMITLEAATVAHWLSGSRQVLADSPQLIDWINTIMLFEVLKVFEDKIVSGNGTTDKISGLITQGTVYSPGADHSSDMVGEMLSTMKGLGLTPNLVIMQPQDYFEILSARTTLGSYAAGGGWSAASPTNLWGVNTVATNACPRGTVIGVDTSVVRVLDREQANLQIGYQSDDFIRNKVSMVAELRGQLAISNADGVFVMSIANDSP